MERMTLEGAIQQAKKARAWGLDMSYDANEDALQVLLAAYMELKTAHDVCLDNAAERRFYDR